MAGRHDEAAVQWTVDQVASRHLQSTYGDAVSRRAWDDWTRTSQVRSSHP